MKTYRQFRSYILGGIISIAFIYGIGNLVLGKVPEPITTNSMGVLHHLSIQGMQDTIETHLNGATLPTAPISRFTPITDPLPVANITASSALVVDFATGDILYQKNPMSRHQLASITKLLTAAVVLDEYTWGTNTYLTMTQEAFDTYGGDSLQVGAQFMVEDLLSTMLMVSSNDSAQLLADSFGGNDAFIAKMNRKAQSIGMEQSVFVNSHGLDQSPVSNYSDARDVMKLMQYIYDNSPKAMEIMRAKEMIIVSKLGVSIKIGNTNELLGVQGEMLVGKTGLTTEAGETLASVVLIQNRAVGIVVLESDIGGYRFQDTKSLIKWIQDNYSI